MVTAAAAHRGRRACLTEGSREFEVVRRIAVRPARWTVGLGAHPERHMPVRQAPHPDGLVATPGYYVGRVEDVETAALSLMLRVWEVPNGREFLIGVTRGEWCWASGEAVREDVAPTPGDAVKLWVWSELLSAGEMHDRLYAEVSRRMVTNAEELAIDAAIHILRAEMKSYRDADS